MRKKLATWHTKLRVRGIKNGQLGLHDEGDLTPFYLYTHLTTRPKYNREVLHFSRYDCVGFRFRTTGVFCTDGVTAGYHLPGHCPFVKSLIPMTYRIGVR